MPVAVACAGPTSAGANVHDNAEAGETETDYAHINAGTVYEDGFAGER